MYTYLVVHACAVLIKHIFFFVDFRRTLGGIRFRWAFILPIVEWKGSSHTHLELWTRTTKLRKRLVAVGEVTWWQDCPDAGGFDGASGISAVPATWQSRMARQPPWFPSDPCPLSSYVCAGPTTVLLLVFKLRLCLKIYSIPTADVFIQYIVTVFAKGRFL